MMALQVPPRGIVAANDVHGLPPSGDAGPAPIGALDGVCHIGGDGSVMLAEAVDAWARAAIDGQRIVYGIGHLPVWSKGAALMRGLAERGLVHLFHDRRPSPKHYVAVRTAVAWREPTEAARVARAVPSYDPHLAVLFDLLRELAAEAAPCPTNGELATRLGLDRGQQVSYLLGCLAKAGKIRVTFGDSTGPSDRVVTIVASGRSTAAPGAGA